MEEKNTQDEQQPVKPAGRYIRMKPFALIMFVFAIILLTAGLTIFALTFGEKKVVEVKVPVERQEFSQLYDAFDEVEKNYYQEVDKDKLVEGAVNGMLDALDDPYSDYMTKEEAKRFEEGLSSGFEGIGAVVEERDGKILISSPQKNSPAEKAGLLPRDIVTAVDGKSIAGKNVREAVELIRGEKGTEVTLTIKRGDTTPFDVAIKRDTIPIETVFSELLDGGIAHVQLTSFSEKTYDELVEQLTAFEEKGLNGIVLDVRQNPGGFLEQAIMISNLFVDDGKNIVQTEERGKKPLVQKAKGAKQFDVPVTIIVDGGSASASEILAGALQESANVTVVGEKSFGKGTMQTMSKFTDGSEIKYTKGKWLTPNGNWINEKGIEPQVKVDYPEYMKLPFLNTTQPLKVGTASESVKVAEQMLEAIGYAPGDVDGIYDEQTAEAVAQLQQDNELQATGEITTDTAYLLMDKLRDKGKADDPQLKKALEVVKEEITKK